MVALNITMDCTNILKETIMVNVFIILGSLFLVAGFILNEIEMKFREKKELFKANFIVNIEYISLIIGIVIFVTCLFFV